MTPGRPRKNRVPGSGEKLRRALEILGWSWGKNSAAAGHVLQNARWEQCGLPKSVNTILDDIKLGLPVDRLAGYASFLNLPAELMQREDIGACSPAFLESVFSAREEATALHLPLFSAYDRKFCQRFYADNDLNYMEALFARLQGVHVVHITHPPSTEIRVGCVLVHAAEAHHLCASVLMRLRGVDVPHEAVIFRWGNNLHISFYSRDLFIFGRMLAEDPLRSFAASHRKPFRLHLSGISDATTGPGTFTIIRARSEQVVQAGGAALRDGWERVCRDVRARPVILPSDPDHATLLTAVAGRESRRHARHHWSPVWGDAVPGGFTNDELPDGVPSPSAPRPRSLRHGR